jgi:DNA-binding NtrC family response regulator
MINVTLEVRKIAKMTSSVLVTGPSGSGKEVIARKIHQGSERSKEPFVPVNCGAIAEELIESELFGHERGSFTGAISDRKGFFEEADGGTIFLDEITETSPAFQVKLLRVLQEHRITRVGSSQEMELEVRVIASSNRDLSQAVAAGDFREDLYYRLNRSEICLPALKDRREDIEPLAFHFAHATVRKTGRPVVFSKGAMMALHSYNWPGNVRELQSVVDSAVQGCNRMVLIGDLPKALRVGPGDLKSDEASVVGGSSPLLTLAEASDAYCLEVLKRCGGNQTRAAEILAVDRKTIFHKSKKNGWNKRFAGEWRSED